MTPSIQKKYDSLPPQKQNNARSIFMSDYKRATSEMRKLNFAVKWDLDFHTKYCSEPSKTPVISKWVTEMSEEEKDLLAVKLNIY